MRRIFLVVNGLSDEDKGNPLRHVRRIFTQPFPPHNTFLWADGQDATLGTKSWSSWTPAFASDVQDDLAMDESTLPSLFNRSTSL